MSKKIITIKDNVGDQLVTGCTNGIMKTCTKSRSVIEIIEWWNF